MQSGLCTLTHSSVHPSACIDPSAEIHPSAEIGPYVTVGRQSRIGAGTKIAAHAVIGDYTLIGPDCRIYSHAVVGSPSQDLKHEEDAVSWLEIGARNRIREFVTVNRATADGACTRLGDNNLLMAYAHVAHDCELGSQIVLANHATLGGHVQLEDEVVVGAMSGIHQFVRLGRLSMIGAMSRICHDVPPFMLANGSPARVYGLNTVGLRRAGLTPETRQLLKQAYQLLYRRSQSLSQAIFAMQALPEATEIQHLLTFLERSQRGLLGPERQLLHTFFK